MTMVTVTIPGKEEGSSASQAFDFWDGNHKGMITTFLGTPENKKARWAGLLVGGARLMLLYGTGVIIGPKLGVSLGVF